MTGTALTTPTDLAAPSAFTSVLAQVNGKPELSYSQQKLPPTPPFKRPHHILQIQKDAIPRPQHAYFEMWVCDAASVPLRASADIKILALNPACATASENYA